ncbi:MAG: DUF5662 family protein [Nanoarchaeota archaeon]
MGWYRIAESRPENYDEMKGWFEKRTKKHIELVQKYCKEIEKYNPEKFKGLIDKGKSHDESKFKDPEIEPYIYIAWDYKCKDDKVKFDIPKEIKEKMNQATEHHVKNNDHHPEKHTNQKNNLINRENRDKPPEELIDATKMKDLDIAEMVADWLAMSEEKNSQPKSWADKNVNIRWKFTDKQKDLIYQLIDDIWE